MQPRKLRIGIARFSYGGNGGIATEVPDVGTWLVRAVIAAKSDPRVEDVVHETFTDTPVTLTRNASVAWAQKAGVDVLLMVDSDMSPDLYVGIDRTATPFFESSFDFLYRNWEKGPRIVVSPYCGPPAHPTEGGHENVYVFHWEVGHTDHLPQSFKMQAYTRHEAAVMTGISTIDTGPTGLSMYDMRIFESLVQPYFDYEWEGERQQCDACHQQIPGPRTQKATTEDCFFFRNVATNAVLTLGYNPVYCNWDAWSGHWKPWCVGKPVILTSDGVGRHLKEAVLKGVKQDTKLVKVGTKSQDQLRKEFEAQNGPSFTSATTGELVPMYPAQLPGANDLGHRTPDGVLQSLQALVKAHLDCKPGPITIVELGSWVGKSAIAMAEACGCRGHVIHCYDLWDLSKGEDWVTNRMLEAAPSSDGDPVYRQFRTNTAVYDNIIGHRQDTVVAAASWGRQGRPIDILYIDASHTYEAVKANIQAWLPYMADGAIVAGDDFGTEVFSEVRRAVTECFGAQVRSHGDLWWTVIGRPEVSPSVSRRWAIQGVYGDQMAELTDADVGFADRQFRSQEDHNHDDAQTRGDAKEAGSGGAVRHDRRGGARQPAPAARRPDRSRQQKGLNGRVRRDSGARDQEGPVGHDQASIREVLHRPDEDSPEDDWRSDAGRNHEDD